MGWIAVGKKPTNQEMWLKFSIDNIRLSLQWKILLMFQCLSPFSEEEN